MDSDYPVFYRYMESLELFEFAALLSAAYLRIIRDTNSADHEALVEEMLQVTDLASRNHYGNIVPGIKVAIEEILKKNSTIKFHEMLQMVSTGKRNAYDAILQP